MRVIARGTLLGFVRNRVEPKQREGLLQHLTIWHMQTLRAAWKNSAELKEQYRSASIVSAERVVFNIKGKEYRLLLAIN